MPHGILVEAALSAAPKATNFSSNLCLGCQSACYDRSFQTIQHAPERIPVQHTASTAIEANK